MCLFADGLVHCLECLGYAVFVFAACLGESGLAAAATLDGFGCLTYNR